MPNATLKTLANLLKMQEIESKQYDDYYMVVFDSAQAPKVQRLINRLGRIQQSYISTHVYFIKGETYLDVDFKRDRIVIRDFSATVRNLHELLQSKKIDYAVSTYMGGITFRFRTMFLNYQLAKQLLDKLRNAAITLNREPELIYQDTETKASITFEVTGSAISVGY